jgi:IS66 C-terminal element
MLSSRDTMTGPKIGATLASLIETAKLNGIDPQAWLARYPHPSDQSLAHNRLDELLPWTWAAARSYSSALPDSLSRFTSSARSSENPKGAETPLTCNLHHFQDQTRARDLATWRSLFA